MDCGTFRPFLVLFTISLGVYSDNFVGVLANRISVVTPRDQLSQSILTQVFVSYLIFLQVKVIPFHVDVQITSIYIT